MDNPEEKKELAKAEPEKKPRPVKKKGRGEGRPTLFKKDMLKEAYALSQVFCATYHDLARYWGVSHSTVSRWVQRNPEFCTAIEKGREVSKVGLVTSLIQQGKKGNLGAIIFTLTNMFPDEWRDRRNNFTNVNVNSNRVENGVGGEPETPAEVIAKQRALLERLTRDLPL